LLMYGGVRFGRAWFEEMLKHLIEMSPDS